MVLTAFELGKTNSRDQMEVPRKNRNLLKIYFMISFSKYGKGPQKVLCKPVMKPVQHCFSFLQLFVGIFLNQHFRIELSQDGGCCCGKRRQLTRLPVSCKAKK